MVNSADPGEYAVLVSLVTPVVLVRLKIFWQFMKDEMMAVLWLRQTGPMRGGQSIMGPLVLAIEILFWFFFICLVFSIIFSLFRYVIWTFCCTGNKAFMEVYQWFHWTSNLQFWEKSQPVPRALNQYCFALQHFSWKPWRQTEYVRGHLWHRYSIAVNQVMKLRSDDFHLITRNHWCSSYLDGNNFLSSKSL